MAIVLLLLAVPALSTLAKQSWYLPQSNTAHYLNGAVKMRVSQAPLLTNWRPLPALATLVPQRAENRMVRRAEPKPAMPDIGITVSLQHRSPPIALL
jgi:hypothetical protein